MKKLLCAFLVIVIFFSVQICIAEGLLPSLSETVGIAMPSLGEALGRYPDEETENEDGSITELYTNVSESDFNAFSVYLQQREAELADYKVEKGVLTAEIQAKGAAFSLRYNSKSGEARVTYPSGTFDERMKNAKTHYDTGKKLLEAGRIDEALVEFMSIPQYNEYNPVETLLKEDEKLAAVAAHEAKCEPFRVIGNVVTFGIYPQTEEGNDQTPIEWFVLDYDEANHKALLISKYGLDVVQYNNKFTEITWEQCTLRTWLNGEFLKKAFSVKEQSAILITDVDNSSAQGDSGGADGGNNTRDKIFLLSFREYFNYFLRSDSNKDLDSCVAPTAYAISQGAEVNRKYKNVDGELTAWWCLRSPGSHLDTTCAVDPEGKSGRSAGVINKNGVVRPALWLDLDADIF